MFRAKLATIIVLLICPITVGCAHQREHSVVRLWTDYNTLRRPALFMEQVDHRPYHAARVGSFLWMYGQDPGHQHVYRNKRLAERKAAEAAALERLEQAVVVGEVETPFVDGAVNAAPSLPTVEMAAPTLKEETSSASPELMPPAPAEAGPKDRSLEEPVESLPPLPELDESAWPQSKPTDGSDSPREQLPTRESDTPAAGKPLAAPLPAVDLDDAESQSAGESDQESEIFLPEFDDIEPVAKDEPKSSIRRTSFSRLLPNWLRPGKQN